MRLMRLPENIHDVPLTIHFGQVETIGTSILNTLPVSLLFAFLLQKQNGKSIDKMLES